MGGTIRARLKNGALEPLEKLDLPEGKEVTVTILRIPSRLDFAAFTRAAGGWKGSIDAERLIRDIYAGRLVSTRPAPHL
jgi:predicted DNA-binding antitoxin AbrB/MazE fold protein